MLSVLAREGDPSPAIALAVVTEGGLSVATALSAVVESRLEQAGFAHLEAQASWDGYRLTALLPDPGSVTPFVAALRDALLTPLSPGSVEMSRAAERLATLDKQPFAEAEGESFWRCTGDPVRFASDARLDLSKSEGVAQLESFRQRSHLASRLSLGVVGQRAVGDEVTRAIASSARWPDGPGPREAEREPADLRVAVVEGRDGARARIAFRVSDAARAKLVAERVSDPTGLLATRLGSLGSAWRITEITAAARARGGCLAVTAEPVIPLPESLVEASSLRAASLLLQELRAELGDATTPPEARDPWRSAIDASDPREASALAAWWAFSARGRGGEIEARPSILAELPPGPDRDREARRSRFATALKSSETPARDLVIEPRVRVERGQNRLWLLVASPCPSAESSADSGLTALAILSAAAAGSRDGVSLEPWLSPEGAGLLAHAAPRPGESPWDLAARVAREAARALATSTHDPAGFASARAILLTKLAAQGPALEVAAKALSPTHPSWISPLGTWNAATRLGSEAAALRAHALASGPLEIAVLADHHAEQGEIAARTVERWLSRGSEPPRSCPSRASRPEPTPGLFEVELGPGAAFSRALLAFPLSGSSEREQGAWLAAGLEGAEGWLAQSLRSLPNAQATARILGGGLASALLIEVRAKDELIEDAIAQVRGLLLRISSGAIAAEDLDRARRHRSQAHLESSLDPRRRIVDLFLGRGPLPPQPRLEEIQTFAKEALRDDKAILVLARPRSLVLK